MNKFEIKTIEKKADVEITSCIPIKLKNGIQYAISFKYDQSAMELNPCKMEGDTQWFENMIKEFESKIYFYNKRKSKGQGLSLV